MEPANLSWQIWVVATIFGGVGATIINWFRDYVIERRLKLRIKKHIRRELSFNVNQIEENLTYLINLKEEYIKFDRPERYDHFFVFKPSAVVFKSLINAGMIYDYLDDHEMIVIDNVVSENTEFLNSEVGKIRSGEHLKPMALHQVEWFIERYKKYKNALDLILEKFGK